VSFIFKVLRFYKVEQLTTVVTAGWVYYSTSQTHWSITDHFKWHSLSELLSKDSTSLDPGRVINISSTSSVDPQSEGHLSSAGSGTYSCAYLISFYSILPLTSAVHESVSDNTSKAAGGYNRFPWRESDFLTLPFFTVNHLTSQLALTLGTRHITYVHINVKPQFNDSPEVQSQCNPPGVRLPFPRRWTLLMPGHPCLQIVP